MTKKHFMIVSLLLTAGFLLISSVASAAAQDPAVSKFVKAWNEAQVFNDEINIRFQDVQLLASVTLTTMADSMTASDYKEALKSVNAGVAEINLNIANINKQMAKMAVMQKTAPAIKNTAAKASAKILADKAVAFDKALMGAVKAQKDELAVLKTELTARSKGKSASAAFKPKLAATNKIIGGYIAKAEAANTALNEAVPTFNTAAGVTLTQ